MPERANLPAFTMARLYYDRMRTEGGSSSGERHAAGDKGYFSAPDVVLILNQLELPDDFLDADLDQIREVVSDSRARAEVQVLSGAEPRDPFTAAAVIFVIHFVTSHGLEVSLVVLEAGIWEGVRSLFGTLCRRPHEGEAHEPARRFRVGITYPDGMTVTVEAASAEELREAVRTLRAAGT
jgi:hypothetical protein